MVTETGIHQIRSISISGDLVDRNEEFDPSREEATALNLNPVSTQEATKRVGRPRVHFNATDLGAFNNPLKITKARKEREIRYATP